MLGVAWTRSVGRVDLFVRRFVLDDDVFELRKSVIETDEEEEETEENRRSSKSDDEVALRDDDEVDALIVLNLSLSLSLSLLTSV